MKLNEFVGIDHPSDKLHVGSVVIERMIERADDVDTEAFLYVFNDLLRDLSNIATERALDRKWNCHPMFGIDSEKCSDKWAVAYHKNSRLAERVLSILILRTVEVKK